MLRSRFSRFAAFTILLATAALVSRAPASQGGTRVPTIDDLLKLKSVGGAQISPDAKWIAYQVTDTDFKQDAYINHIWLANVATGKSIQLTRGEKSAGNPQWSPDSQWLAFTSPRIGDKNQLFVIRPDGGEATQITKNENGVGGYSWSRDGKMIAFTASDVPTQLQKDRKEQLGDYEVIRKEYSFNHLWTINVADALREPATGTQRTKGKDFNVGGFSWSPDGSKIAFGATINPDLINGVTSDIYVLNLSDNSTTKIVSQPGFDNSPVWSPDGSQIVFASAMGNIKSFASNSRLAVVPATGGTPKSLTDSFDESPNLIDWLRDGIYFFALQKTASHVFRLDPASGRISRLTGPDEYAMGFPAFSADGKQMAWTTSSPTTVGEVYTSPVDKFAPRKLTTMTDQLKPFTVASREVISWKSQDGTTVEGILIKPASFDPARKYPLLCVIHGGPTGIDRPTLLDTRYYPVDIWAARGALILKVNYRGSAGYGEKFRQLNVRNLGVGDAWDVLSGIDYLIAKGWVDPQKIGCMGWSQGGYISAFLTTSSTRFSAISVGAGISNWATYYYNTDITPFTINYLGDDPADDPQVYLKTSPMTYIKQAKTPTLIQHGENDRRVPIANAYELRQGLEDRGVKAEMVVYKGFGHGITKPRAMRAVMEHNLLWFNHYIFGDPLKDFTNPDLTPKEASASK